MSLTRAASPLAVRFHTLAIGATVTYDSAASVRYTHRVWWAAPSRWRDDVTWPNGQTLVSIARDGAALTYVSVLRTLYTSEPVASADGWEIVPPPRGIVYLPTVEDRIAEFPLLRPPPSAAEWAFTDGPPTEYLGRPCRRVYAVRRPGAPTSAGPGGFGYLSGVDEYEYLIDDGLQLVVRLTGLAGGIPVTACAADDVQVDAPLPPEVFDFQPPPGTRVAHVVWRG